MKTKSLFLAVFIAFGYLALFISTYKLLEKPAIYNRYFSSFMPTYETQNNSTEVVKKPFTATSAKSFEETMDAYHYACIKNNLYNYDPNDEVSRSNFAFFPLFPLAWKISMLSGKGIIIVNFLLHLASILILTLVFCPKSVVQSLLVIFALPTLTVFLIPYSEALFMFSISIALLGWKRQNNMLYILGLLLASMTRPVFILLIGAAIATEIFFLICDKKRKIQYKQLIITISTVLTGTFLVTLFQWTYHHGSLLTFINAQKHWGTFLQVPGGIVDWSREGYGMNVWALVFCCVFGGIILFSKFLRRKELETETYDYWYYFSWIYMILATLFVLLLQGGCLHSLYRYTLCTPFFYIIIFQHLNNGNKLSLSKPLLIYTLFLILCVLFIETAWYSREWNFSKTGFVLLSSNLLFFILMQYINNAQRYIGLGILILTGIIWNCYLLNMFVTKAWIFL